jgi:hypothetical protein
VEKVKANYVLYDIAEVVETNMVSEVNERLSNGWRLLEIYTETYDPEHFYKHQSVNYVLGRSNEPNTK